MIFAVISRPVGLISRAFGFLVSFLFVAARHCVGAMHFSYSALVSALRETVMDGTRAVKSLEALGPVSGERETRRSPGLVYFLMALSCLAFVCMHPVVAWAGFELEPGSFRVVPSSDQTGSHADLTTSFPCSRDIKAW